MNVARNMGVPASGPHSKSHTTNLTIADSVEVEPVQKKKRGKLYHSSEVAGSLPVRLESIDGEKSIDRREPQPSNGPSDVKKVHRYIVFIGKL